MAEKSESCGSSGNIFIGMAILVCLIILILLSASVIPVSNFANIKERFSQSMGSLGNMSSIQKYTVPMFPPNNPFAQFATYGNCKEIIILNSNSNEDKEKVIRKILNDGEEKKETVNEEKKEVVKEGFGAPPFIKR